MALVAVQQVMFPDKGLMFQGMAAKGTLAKLTVNDLKKDCELHHLLKGGKKDDLIQRIKEHLEKT